MNPLQFAQRFWTIGIRFLLRQGVVFFTAGIILIGLFGPADAFTKKEIRAFQRSIVDRQRKLNPKFHKTFRKKTKYIIVHTSEAGFTSTLRAVCSGKKLRSGRRTRGGHTHYVISRTGRTYRILDKRYQADHAGLSMWDRDTNLSKLSIGIELVGYHYTPITEKQYRSVGLLLDILKRVYGLNDAHILTHSQVAYGKPNRWFKRAHRGRKRCAKNFDRRKAGLASTWSFDPDVRAGRLMKDPELASIFYARLAPSESVVGSNIITLGNSAWVIAGEEYDSPTTLYRLPNGKSVRGDQLEKRIGWDRIPKNTVVLLNQEPGPDAEKNLGPIKNISNGSTAWDFAGSAYNKVSTFYFFPGGPIKNGKQISDWDELPSSTKMIIGYRGPYQVTGNRPPIKIAGTSYKKKETLYYLPNKKIVPGDAIGDFRRLPRGVLVFLPERG